MGGGLESHCVDRVYGADGADGAVQKTIRCNTISNAPDDGRYVPETCRPKNILIKLTCIKLAFHIISFLIPRLFSPYTIHCTN